MSWFGLVWPFLVAVGVLFLPGLAAGFLAGLRSPIALWGTAPVVSVAVVATASVFGPLLGLSFGVLPVLLVSIVAAGVAFGLRRLGDRRDWERPGADSLGVSAAGFGGLAVSAVLAGVTVARGIGHPDGISQTYDSNFHLNAVQFILDTGNASPLHVGTMTQPEASAAFYPSAWHALAALVAQIAGASPAVAIVAMTFAVCGVLWPASGLLLTRQIAGPKPVPMLAAGVLAAAFTTFPFLLVGFGVLYPNLLSFALVPAALAGVVAVLRLSPDCVLGRLVGALLIVAGLPAIGLAHPNGVFTFALFSVAALLSFALREVPKAWVKPGGPVRVVVVITAVLVGTSLLSNRLAKSPLLAGVQDFDWKANRTVPGALGDWVLQCQQVYARHWALAALVVIGCVVAAARGTGWLLIGYMAAGVLYIYGAALDTPLSNTLTGFWYNDPFRLAAMAPLLGLPLAALGAGRVVEWLHERVPVSRRVSTTWLGVAGLAVLVVATNGLHSHTHSGRIAFDFQARNPDGELHLLDDQERAFYLQEAARIGADERVAGNPWNGSGMIYGLTGRQVLFPHLGGKWGKDRELVRLSLREASRRPEVCAAVKRLNLRWAVDSGSVMWPGDARTRSYPGLDDLGRARGFVPVARSGDTVLYKITACDR